MRLVALSAVTAMAAMQPTSFPLFRHIRRGPASINRCNPITCCTEGEGVEDEEVEATVYARKKGQYVKKPVDNRDRLAYELTDVTPPERRLGTYKLAPNLGCGDMVEIAEDTFVVKRISYRYAYSAGRYRMVSKGAAVVKAGRLGIERALGRLLPEKDGAEANGSCDA
eukprot:CAMPEP_0119073390 /NCGR_PEP_ID=MMETSP1178-20130426/64920_1 /TAXON_ID=33656 /ORGANISM="unid sp, Strain CCMP2000" /LENGTH=167 /DNA_ID=CAMNT_0007055467 /DNA_START=1 /DNA_END=504 /DNA_ORIENTATION=+